MAASFDLSGKKMCKSCHNGFHREPGETASAVVISGLKQLCECPCHLPRAAFKEPGKKSPAAKPVQSRFECGTSFIGANS